MSFLAILMLAIGLAMDATAVAAARGLATRSIAPQQVLLVALLFGGAQALMPLLGWQVGMRVGPLFAQWHPWIIFALLGGIGAKMLWEARGADESIEQPAGNPFGLRLLLVLALATSLDAFAAGLTLPLMHAPMALSLATIGVVTAVLSALGLYAGRRFGALLGKRLDVVGGVVLIGLGVKALIQHLSS